MRRERSGFVLSGIVLTAITCLGVIALIMSAAGVLPENLPVLSAARDTPRRHASVPAPAPTTAKPSVTPTPTPSPTRTPTVVEPTPGPTRTRTQSVVTPVTPTTTPPTTSSPAAPSCKAGAQTVTAVVDTFVDQATPTTAYGRDQTLSVTSRDRDRNSRALVRFAAVAVPKGCTVRGATLTMTAREATGRRILVARASRGWNEATATWANGPVPTGYAIGATVSGRQVRWSLPVHAMGTYGYVLYDAAESDRGAGVVTGFASRDSRTPPTLTVRWA